jgi:hypothetical protein
MIKERLDQEEVTASATLTPSCLSSSAPSTLGDSGFKGNGSSLTPMVVAFLSMVIVDRGDQIHSKKDPKLKKK